MHLPKDFNQLKKNLKKDFSDLKKIKVALMGDTSTQFLSQALKGLAFERSLNLEVWESDFNQIERQVFDPGSELYQHEPDVIIIFQSTHKLLGKYNKLNPSEFDTLADRELSKIDSLVANIKGKTKAKVLFYNYPEINDSVFGNFASKHASSFLFQLRKLNYELMIFASKNNNFFICDISSVQNYLGKPSFFHTSVYINTEMVLSIQALPYVASVTMDIISSIEGKFKKCVILDLDNTTWGGIIGDDGIENIQVGTLGIGKAFSEFQYWIKKLKHRGIIVAVCSKNTESVAKEPFEKHPEMVLRLADISVFVANWENKADNIRKIQQILNIGFDSMVFLDDNPFERNMVRENLPEVTVPELPEDPAEYLEYLYALNLFETTSFSKEDEERTKLYQVEAQRVTEQQSYANEGDFLKSLNMLSVVEPFNKFNTPRVAQLSQRSNQYNLRTVRYTDSEIEALSGSDKHVTFSFTLEDKFGDNGLICVVILSDEDPETVFIENWFMSCRVLKRGMEHFVLNKIVEAAKQKGAIRIKGEYLPTAKNDLVKDHYQSLGFTKSGDFWVLPVDTYQEKDNFIKDKLIA